MIKQLLLILLISCSTAISSQNNKDRSEYDIYYIFNRDIFMSNVSFEPNSEVDEYNDFDGRNVVNKFNVQNDSLKIFLSIFFEKDSVVIYSDSDTLFSKTLVSIQFSDWPTDKFKVSKEQLMNGLYLRINQGKIAQIKYYKGIEKINIVFQHKRLEIYYAISRKD